MPAEFDVIGPWSEVKLDIVRKYADSYSKILTAQHFCHLYIDGFAGPGMHVLRHTNEFVTGSPINALLTQPPFDEYHFVDADPQRVSQLKDFVAGRKNVYVHLGDCNEKLLKDIFPRAKYEHYKRALCVLDPYNIDLSWEIVETAGKMRSVEIFLNFMVMDMNMNILLTDPQGADAAQVSRMNRFWGDDSWRGIAYRDDPQQSLFGQSEKIKFEDANARLAEAYRQRLLDVAGFNFAPPPLPFRNSIGRTIYFLFFASPDATANKIVQQIFDKYRGRNWP